MIAAPLHLGGERLMLCPTGVAIWPSTRMLVVSDLHFEKGSAMAVRGAHVPPYDTRETMIRLAFSIRRHAPRRLLVLGDALHDDRALARMAPADLAALRRLLEPLEVIWVAGNHDPAPQPDLPGISVPEWSEGRLRFRHIGGVTPLARHEAELSGHYHPKATMPTRIGGITRPCFLATGQRLVLPAFGAFTGGLDVRDPAMATVAKAAQRVFLLGRERLHSASFEALRA
ncbi:ligase-associated DNA damage response endonuclease PdeM [Roseococcus sp. SYP-B2431]|uniref:ligase-associated DNA damage response endonuclease PdeM n=1 Tax=Roseococcus sp. SYP-B2431 TaxID=2496640 RepID=UPI00103FC0F4|nr:ligase-associated DNA damage response endonuclease PdeM [Roseococcus sp. SYP-B2431]TCH99950.1 ligase-associated DNA damage response endonuclease PdeM [Roseococcus sp. SYP-B2431]